MENDPGKLSPQENQFVRRVGSQAERKLRQARDPNQGVWFGLGLAGLIGWSISIPTFLGALLGLWLDRHHPGRISWTLALLAAGLVLGCGNAWHWVREQDRAMHERPEDSDE